MSATGPIPCMPDTITRRALRCTPIPPLKAETRTAGPFRSVPTYTLMRRGAVFLAALALPALMGTLADPVHRARLPRATQAAVAPTSPSLGAAAAPFDTGSKPRIVLSSLALEPRP